MWGRSLKSTRRKLTWDLSPNITHDIDRPVPSNMPKTGPSRPTKGSAGPPRPAELIRRSVQPFFIHHAGLHPKLTPPCSNKFWSKISTPNHNAKKGLALHALSWINLHTLYALHSIWFLWTIIIIGNPCYLSNWRMWYDWMNGTMLFLAKYLGFLFKKKEAQWLVSSKYKFLPRPK